jgi:hypothetical protein
MPIEMHGHMPYPIWRLALKCAVQWEIVGTRKDGLAVLFGFLGVASKTEGPQAGSNANQLGKSYNADAVSCCTLNIGPLTVTIVYYRSTSN